MKYSLLVVALAALLITCGVDGCPPTACKDGGACQFNQHEAITEDVELTADARVRRSAEDTRRDQPAFEGNRAKRDILKPGLLKSIGENLNPFSEMNCSIAGQLNELINPFEFSFFNNKDKEKKNGGSSGVRTRRDVDPNPAPVGSPPMGDAAATDGTAPPGDGAAPASDINPEPKLPEGGAPAQPDLSSGDAAQPAGGVGIADIMEHASKAMDFISPALPKDE